ncbi:hypothetical protein [Variovorax saccharolyticus]|uniref:hypothetical protein n=1 Tax=Variovorax saccharolyticus TaxID=3053516 RepID=UPI00257697F4|nr:MULTISPECIES: hypothetical protein [unclassified Variovorax]MDM0018741.1 hypothetical protein [Variovorax sp. J22R187]MDM0029249.1 hypothetical protein [Variovorax sp. J31P216]
MDEKALADKLKQLDQDRARLEREKLEFEQKKMQRLTLAISAVALVVSGLQVGVAWMQSRLATAQTVERFIPHIQKPETRDAALLTMAAFTDQDFVTQLAEKLKATTVLETLQSRGSGPEQARATEALSALDSRRKALLARIYDADKQKRIQATTELIQQWIGDPRLVPDLLSVGGTRTSNQSGTINALVILRETTPEALRTNISELQPFLDQARSNGPQTAALVAEVQGRLARLPAASPGPAS